MMVFKQLTFVALQFIILIHVGEGIINGKLASLGEWTFMVSLHDLDDNDHACGASILNEYWVLTAAHCVADGYPDSLILRAGVVNRLDTLNSRLIPTDYFVIHDDYVPALTRKDPQTGEEDMLENAINDVALIRVEGKIQFESFVQPLNNLPLADAVLPIHVECQFKGWGAENSDKPNIMATHLNEEDLTVMDKDNDPLRSYCHSLDSTTFCGGDMTYNSSPCNGDSGGPLICNGTIYGVASDSYCTRGLPILFSFVPHYIPWIEETITFCEEHDND